MQVLLLIRQMEATASQATASKVSLLMLGHQAIMDAHLCLLHLTTGVQSNSQLVATRTASLRACLMGPVACKERFPPAWQNCDKGSG